VYIQLLHQAWRRLQKGVEDGVGARMEYAEDHYVQVESAMLRSLCCTPARYNFGVSQWLGCGRKVKTTTMTTATVPRIGGGRRAVETVLCNNNWMAVSFHLGMTPFTSRDRRRTKKRKKDPAQGATARDEQSVLSYDDGNDSRATTSGCGCEILQRASPRSATPASFASIFLFLDRKWTLEVSCVHKDHRVIIRKTTQHF